MTDYIITISYDGSKYRGLQKLKEEKTVQGELESILSKLDRQPVKVISSGRTDRGVHALMQVCTFSLHRYVDPYRLRYYIDKSTSKYLYVKTCDYLTDKSFHPRFSVKSKTYKYVINTGAYDPILADYVHNYNKNLSIDKMKEASTYFLGTHNFRAFVVGPQKTCESTIFDITVDQEGEKLVIRISGVAFYTYMVRNIVTVLILVGSNQLGYPEIKKMLDYAKKTVEFAPAPPGGLYLETIEY